MNQPESISLELVQPTALESIERANVDMQISTAKKYPRSLGLVKNRMMDLATLDQETAESCFYKLNRQGKSIEGPSIRLAEIAASSFGNIRYGARVISNDGKKITAQGFSHDLETNVYCAVEISRRITNREGITYSEDMQVVTGNAACAIALRNAMFKVVPFALVKPIYEAAKQAAVGDIKTLAERRTRMLKQFSAMGVDEKRICATLEKTGIEEIGLAELETLIGMYNAIKDGEQKIDEAFPAPIAKANVPTPERPAAAPAVEKPEKPARAKKTPTAKPEPQSGIAGDVTVTISPAAQIAEKLTEAGYTEAEFVDMMIRENWCETIAKKISDVSEDKLEYALTIWDKTLIELGTARENEKA